MHVLCLLLLFGPAETIAGKYVRHSEEFLRRHPQPAQPIPAELPSGVDALCGLIEAGHDSPRLFAALGEALLLRGDKELAYRAFDKAHRANHPDPRYLARRKDECVRVPDAVIRSEEHEARVWVDALQSFERARIAAGDDPRDLAPFYERYGRPEDDLNAIIRAHRIAWAGGVAGAVLGVGFAAAARLLKKRAAIAPLVVGALCLAAPVWVGMTGLLGWGAGFAFAGAAVVLIFGGRRG